MVVFDDLFVLEDAEIDEALKKDMFTFTDATSDQPKNNQGRERCFQCGTRTRKVDTGMFTVYDVCPKCKI